MEVANDKAIIEKLVDDIIMIRKLVMNHRQISINWLSDNDEPVLTTYNPRQTATAGIHFYPYNQYITTGAGCGGSKWSLNEVIIDLLYKLNQYHCITIDELSAAPPQSPVVIIWNVDEFPFDSITSIGTVFVGGINKNESDAMNDKLKSMKEAAILSNLDSINKLKETIQIWRALNKIEGRSYTKDMISACVNGLII
jgi:hypothetical protein